MVLMILIQDDKSGEFSPSIQSLDQHISGRA